MIVDAELVLAARKRLEEDTATAGVVIRHHSIKSASIGWRHWLRLGQLVMETSAKNDLRKRPGTMWESDATPELVPLGGEALPPVQGRETVGRLASSMAPPVEGCLGVSLKLSLLPIARQDVVIRHCKPKATDPTDDIDLQATAHGRMVGSALRASHGYRWPSARCILIGATERVSSSLI
jgi:hypothetical protein